jgi:hypothetical protein
MERGIAVYKCEECGLTRSTAIEIYRFDIDDEHYDAFVADSMMSDAVNAVMHNPCQKCHTSGSLFFERWKK